MEASSLLRGERTPSTPARRRRGLVFLVVGLGACALLGARTRRGGGAARLVTEDEVDTTPKTTHTEPTGHVDASGVFETEVDLREREPHRTTRAATPSRARPPASSGAQLNARRM